MGANILHSYFIIFLENQFLITLKSHFEKYFLEETKQYNWIKDPFIEKSIYISTEEEHLIDISLNS